MISSNFSLSVSLSLVSDLILGGISSLWYVYVYVFPIPYFIQAIDESVASMQTVRTGFQAFRLQGDVFICFHNRKWLE